MEDLFGLLLFLLFAAISVIGNLAKKGTAEGSSGGTSSLKDLLKTIKNELTGNSEVSGKAVVDPIFESEDVLYGKELYTKPIMDSCAPFKVVNSVVEKKMTVSPEQLRQAFIWKEIIDPPISMR